MRPGRQLAALGLIFAVLYLLVFFGGSGGLKDRLEPKLGLDLIGGTRMTLEAATEGGQAPPAASLERAREIIENRVNGLGVSEAEVVTEGNRNIVISLPGQNRNLDEVGNAAELRFRKVLKTADGGAPSSVQPVPTASPEPTPSASPSPSAAVSPSAGGQGGMAPAPTPSAEASPSTEPAPTASPADSAAPVDPSLAEQRTAVQQKVGSAAWAAATGLQAPADFSQDPTLAETLKPFNELSPQEVRVLPATVQFNVPYITCEKLDKRTAGSINDPEQQVVACEYGQVKNFLDKAKVLGTDVKKATAQLDQTTQWVVSLDFTGDGQKKWTNLTREAFNNEGGACDQGALGDEGKCRVAVVLDNQIISSPQIQGVLTGSSQISGSFTRRAPTNWPPSSASAHCR